MLSTIIILTLAAHATLAGAVLSGYLQTPVWVASPLALLSSILSAFVAISASSITVITNSGEIVTRSEPVLGIYSFGLALIAFVLAVAITIAWLPTDNLNGGTSSGY